MPVLSHVSQLPARPLPPRRRAVGRPGPGPAGEVGRPLVALLGGAPAAPPPALPAPQLQIRCASAVGGRPAPRPATGWLAGPGGEYRPAAGPLSTTNYLRLCFGAPLPAAVLAARPKIWLFTHGASPPGLDGGLLAQAGWHHPRPAPGAATEFGGEALWQTLALPWPCADLAIDANHWLGAGAAGPGQCFRFALAAAVPAEGFASAGRHVGALSGEVWLRVGPSGTCAFHAPACPPSAGCPAPLPAMLPTD